MKAFIFSCALLAGSLSALAGNEIVVEQGTKQMVNGIGDHVEVCYAFAKGDKIIVEASSSKKLDKMVAIFYPDIIEVGRVKSAKKVSCQFVMPKEGVVVIRFVADRGGKTNVDYTIHREPANDGVKNYDTKVVWLNTLDGAFPVAANSLR
ncbi:hypothetical protein [Taibaiella soli]|uniref:DUF4783 domain-containing protein n=1 Tax=Taibaiella soli TaxID=1649169 RepID=A0A2W2AYN7_9BACT|nr:hypothetical protein [Taibaiella soli]PZF73124.1 hypothetical protein DN068_09635 [Taibaiella soli]